MIIPYSRQSINQDDIDAINEGLRSDWLFFFIASALERQEGGGNV